MLPSNAATTRRWLLCDRLENNLRQIEATGTNGETAPRVPNTANIYFDYIEGESLVIALDLKGLAVSTGAACSSGTIEPSHVLTAMGLVPTAHGPACASAWVNRTRPKMWT